jgi:hypothetical protein
MPSVSQFYWECIYCIKQEFGMLFLTFPGQMPGLYLIVTKLLPFQLIICNSYYHLMLCIRNNGCVIK